MYSLRVCAILPIRKREACISFASRDGLVIASRHTEPPRRQQLEWKRNAPIMSGSDLSDYFRSGVSICRFFFISGVWNASGCERTASLEVDRTYRPEEPLTTAAKYTRAICIDTNFARAPIQAVYRQACERARARPNKFRIIILGHN